MNITAFDLASRFIGIKEIPGREDNHFIMSMLRLDSSWPGHDEVPWCSAFVNYIAWLLRLPRSKSLTARSWLQVGVSIPRGNINTGFDVVILKRGGPNQPGPDVLDAKGHVGFFAGYDVNNNTIMVLGGNQKNTVSVEGFPIDRILGIRRLFPVEHILV